MSSNVIVDPDEVLVLDDRRSRTPRILDRVLIFGLSALLIFGVLAFGAVEEWSTFAFEAGATALFLIWVGKQLVSRNVGLTKNPLYPPAFLFFVLILAQILLGRSAYSYVTRYEALKYVSYGIVLMIAAECVRAEDARKIFALVMTIFGATYAFFALAQDLTSNSKLFWLRSARFHGAIYGSYVNHDHYAGLMEMLVPIPLALSMSHLLRGGKRVLVGFCAVVMATTIFLSGSRGGMITFVLEMVLLAALILGKNRSPRALLGYAAICVFILALISFSSRGQVLARIGDLSPGIRPQITKDSLRMFLKHPIWGWGLGTFPTVYPRYRTFYTNLFINEAHNDYAQLLTEMGLLGFTLALCFVTGMYHRGLSASRRWQNHWDGTVSLAALIGCTGILLHSIVDFNLQIPANAAMFYVLCALAASEPVPESLFARRIRATAIDNIDTRAPEEQKNVPFRGNLAFLANGLLSGGEMSLKRLAILVLVAVCTFVPHATAQKNELSGLVGRTFISDQGIKGAPSSDPELRFGNGLTFEVNYARRVIAGGFWSLALEVPFVVNPDEDLHAARNVVPQQYFSFFVTPAARLNVFPDAGVSPWVSVGGGLGYFSESSTLLFGGANPGKTGTTTGVFQSGVGLDVKVFRGFVLRGEARDFWSGVPQLNVDTGKSRQHNIFVGGGIVWHF